MNRRDEILSEVRSVPSMPAAATEAAGLARHPDVSFAKLAKVIEYDSGLASNVLRLANSVYFGGVREIGSVKDAVVRLGAKTIFKMVVASAFAPMARRPVKGYELPAGGLWEHSVAVAFGAEHLAEALKLNTPGYLFTAGLLHDIGKIVLGTFLEIDADPIMRLAFEEGVSFEVAERRVLGIDHAEVGAALLDNWNLPESIVEAGRWHHQPEGISGDSLVVDLVHVADALCMTSGIGAGSDGLNYRPSHEAVSRLGLTTEVAETVVCRTLDTLETTRGLFAALRER